MLMRLLIYLILPVSILIYGGVETRIHVPVYLLTGLLTVITLVKQARKKEFPLINKYVLSGLTILLVIFGLQILLGFFNLSQASGSLTYSPVQVHKPFFSLGSTHPQNTLISLSKGIFCISWVYLILCNFQTLNQKIHLLTIFCFAGFFISLFAILKIPMQNLEGFNYAFLQEGFGPFINKNHFAGYIETTVPAVAGLIYLSDTRSKKVLAVFILIVMIIAILLSLSRMGVFSLFSGITLTLILFYKKGNLRINLKWMLPVFVLLSILLAWIGTEGMYDRYKSILNVSQTPHKFARITYLKEAVPMVLDYPVLGTGLAAFNSVFPEYKRSPQQIFVDYLHNDLVQYLIEAGIPGFVISLLLIFYLLKKISASIVIYNKKAQGLCFAGISTFLALGIHSFFDFNLHIPANALCFLTILFLPVSLETRIKVRGPTAYALLIGASVLLTVSGYHLWKTWSFDQKLEHSTKELTASGRVKMLVSLAENSPEYSAVHYQLGKEFFYNAKPLQNVSGLEESIKHLNEAIRLDPNEARGYLRAGIARYHYAVNKENIDHDRVMKNAVSDLETAVLKNRTSALMWYFFGYYSVKKWYDYSEVENDGYHPGIKAWARAIYLDPLYIPRVYKNLFEMFDDYTTLSLPIKSIRSNQDNRIHRLKSTGILHHYLARFLMEHINEVKFPPVRMDDIEYARTLFTQGEELMQTGDFQAARLKFEEILTKNTQPEMLISAHRKTGSCLREELVKAGY